MSNFWENLTVWQKRVTMLAALLAGIVAISGSVWAAASKVATDTEVDTKVAVVNEKLDTYIQQQIVADKQSTIQDAKTELRRIEYELLDEDLSEVKKAFLLDSKRELKEVIECIQTDKTFCQ